MSTTEKKTVSKQFPLRKLSTKVQCTLGKTAFIVLTGRLDSLALTNVAVKLFVIFHFHEKKM
jgi:hypothetical protein